MKNFHLFTALLVLATAAQAQTDDPPAPGIEEDSGHENFTDADADANGVLSIEEAKLALPTLLLEDGNLDGVVNQQEVELALPGLRFVERGHAGGEAPITEHEFGLVVTTMHEQADEKDPLN